MKLKKFLKPDSNMKKSYLKGDRTYKMKNKMKKLKSVVEEEAKTAIHKSKRRESVYTPLDECDIVVESVSAEQNTKSKSKNKKRKSTSTDTEPNHILQTTVQESDIINEKKKMKKNKRKKSKSTNQSESQSVIQDQSAGKQKNKKVSHDNSEIDDNLNTSVSDPLIPESEVSRDSRTIYVGNLPVNFKKKKLLKLLKQYGNVEKMWTRGAKPLAFISKKLAVNKGMLPENHPPLMVHALFKSIAEARTALKLNGEMYDDHRLRVTLSQDKVFDSRKGVFIGNLPFDVKDDDLFDLFQQCGGILSVRVVRDNKFGAGKGFGYVNFKSIDSVELALKLNEEKINGRTIRVKRLLSPGQKKKADKKKEKEMLKSSGSKSKASFPTKKSKLITAEKKSKKKSKLSITDLKKKILAKKLSLKSNKSDKTDPS